MSENLASETLASESLASETLASENLANLPGEDRSWGAKEWRGRRFTYWPPDWSLTALVQKEAQAIRSASQSTDHSGSRVII